MKKHSSHATIYAGHFKEGGRGNNLLNEDRERSEGGAQMKGMGGREFVRKRAFVKRGRVFSICRKTV